MLCFDITNKESFNNVKSKWIKKINEYNTDSIIFLIGIKSDLKDKRVVTYDEAQQYADDETNDIWSYHEIVNKGYSELWNEEVIGALLLNKHFLFEDTNENRTLIRIDSFNKLIKAIKKYKGDDNEKQKLLNNLRQEISTRLVYFVYNGERGEYK